MTYSILKEKKAIESFELIGECNPAEQQVQEVIFEIPCLEEALQLKEKQAQPVEDHAVVLSAEAVQFIDVLQDCDLVRDSLVYDVLLQNLEQHLLLFLVRDDVLLEQLYVVRANGPSFVHDGQRPALVDPGYEHHGVGGQVDIAEVVENVECLENPQFVADLVVGDHLAVEDAV